MEEKIGSAVDILRFQVKRGITNTFKEALTILEDLETEHKAALARLEAELPAEYRALVRTVDYWHNSRREALRKRILSVGGNSYRSIEEQLDNMEVRFK